VPSRNDNVSEESMDFREKITVGIGPPVSKMNLGVCGGGSFTACFPIMFEIFSRNQRQNLIGISDRCSQPPEGKIRTVELVS
jgi:hypothetical protein